MELLFTTFIMKLLLSMELLYAETSALPTSSARHPTNLLQRRVRHAEAAEADVHQRLLQLPEKAGVGPRLEVAAGQQVGQLLADGLNEARLRHVVMHQGRDAFHVP